MASALIHIAVAKEINKELKMDSEELLIGSIAPDLAKLIGDTKHKGHFLNGVKRDVPNIDSFLDKYNLLNPYDMGYFIHLYTDKIWFEEFLPKYYNKTQLRLINGEYVEMPFEEKLKLIYEDYSSINIKLIRDYKLDLNFLNYPYKIDTEISEIPSDNIDILLKDVVRIIGESKESEMNVFSYNDINTFIEKCIKEIKREVIKDEYIISK